MIKIECSCKCSSQLGIIHDLSSSVVIKTVTKIVVMIAESFLFIKYALEFNNKHIHDLCFTPIQGNAPPKLQNFKFVISLRYWTRIELSFVKHLNTALHTNQSS
jgi:hypothetical protein